MLDHEIYGLTSPLLTTSDGKKMGKIGDRRGLAERGHAVALTSSGNSGATPPTPTSGRFLKLYTELPLDECDRLGALDGSEINEAKIVLANEVTALCHGRDAAEAAEATARDVFEKGGIGDDLPTLVLTRERHRRRHRQSRN